MDTHNGADSAGAFNHLLWVVLVKGNALKGELNGAAVAAAMVDLCVGDISGGLGAGISGWVERRSVTRSVETG